MKTVAEYEALLAIANERIKQLEQRLLLSSEAEKGEKTGFPESARRIAVALLTEVMNGMNESLQERITLFLQSQKVFFPSPPSPQEKQGVEEPSEDLIKHWQQKYNEAKRLNDQLRRAATISHEDLHKPYSTPSVEKSEGEEAEAIDAISFAEWIDGNSFECNLHTDDGVKIWDNGGRKHYSTKELFALFKSGLPVKIVLPPVDKKEDSILHKLDKITEDAKAKLDGKLKEIIARDYPKQPPKITDLNNPPVELKNPKNP